MHYLIDGHNLIAKMPDISLADPDDEVRLVLRLRSWAAQRQKRRVTVIFDGGVPGGKDVKLSTPSVRVVFAHEGQTADILLITRIRKAKHPGEYTAVSSDNQIVAAAQKRKMPLLKSEKFVIKLGQPAAAKGVEKTAVAADSPKVTDQEVAEWLDLFGPVPKRAPVSKPTKKKKGTAVDLPAVPPRKSFKNRDWSQAKRDGDGLSEEDVSDWLDLFGEDTSQN